MIATNERSFWPLTYFDLNPDRPMQAVDLLSCEFAYFLWKVFRTVSGGHNVATSEMEYRGWNQF